MLVTKENLGDVIERFSKTNYYACDCEATGLYPYNGDRLFSIILADDDGAAYFNFQSYPDLDDSLVLDDPCALRPIFDNPKSYFFLHNAKYDMALLRFAGLDIAGTVHCTMAIGRVVKNDLLSYSLDNLVKPLGLKKSKAVDEYINTHKLYKKIDIPGKKTKAEIRYYNKVPFEIISDYGIKDGTITRALGYHQLAELERLRNVYEVMPRTPWDIYKQELEVTKVCFEMEWKGMKINPEYSKEASAYEGEVSAQASRDFLDLTGHELKSSPKALAAAFDAIGEPYPRNEPTPRMKKAGKPGNPCFNDKALESMETPAVNLIRAYRKSEKKRGTYYQSFLYFSDDSDFIHTNIRQSGTNTGRFSSADPNLQNVPKRGEDKSEYPVRRAFIPSAPGRCLIAIDYDQMEYKLLLDKAKEEAIIKKILMDGLDVHESTAERMGVEREYAKCVHPDTIIFNGFYPIRIGDVSPNRKKDTFSSPIYDKVLAPNGLTTINSFYSNGEGDTILICARRGLVACSLNHKFKLENGDLVKAKDLKKGDILAETRVINYSKSEYLNLPMNPFLHSSDLKQNTFFCKLNEDLAYVLGLFMGDGCANYKHVSISTGGGSDFLKWRNSVKKSLEKIGLVASIKQIKSSTSRNGVIGKVYFGSRHTVNFLIDMGAMDRDGKKCFKVPMSIFKSPDSVRLSYLAGLFDADGTVSKDGSCSFTTKEWVLAQDFLALCHSLNMHASVEPMYNKRYKKYYFRVRIAKRSSIKLKDYLRNDNKKIRVKEPKFKYSVFNFPNAVVSKIPLGSGPLVDLNIGNESHIYYTNGLETHNTLNFMIIYGGGDAKLAGMLGLPLAKAKSLKAEYFEALPNVTSYTRRLIQTAKTRKLIFNPMGRICHFPLNELAYRAPNYYIQGGCADIIKKAMIYIAPLLRGTNSYMAMQVHDELLFDFDPKDFGLIPEIKRIMEEAYEYKALPLTCSVDHSYKSWADKIAGAPACI